MLEKNGLQISRVKTEFVKFRFKNEVGRNENGYNVTLGGRFVNNIKIFEYLGIITEENGGTVVGVAG